MSSTVKTTVKMKEIRDVVKDESLPVPFPVRPDEVHLRLIKTHDSEVICDQDGRELSGVVGFRYEQVDVDSVPTLTVSLKVNPSSWDAGLGVIKGGEDVSIEPSRLGEGI